MNIFWGKVKKGHVRGKALGFPTANLRLHKNISEGIYISRVRIGSKWLNSLTFIGAAKTFGEIKKAAEVYILDFNQNIYERWITVRLLKKIRENKKFDSINELKKQMKEDEKKAGEYFNEEISTDIS